MLSEDLKKELMLELKGLKKRASVCRKLSLERTGQESMRLLGKAQGFDHSADIIFEFLSSRGVYDCKRLD